VSRLIVLDTGLLGMVTNPSPRAPETERCSRWLERILESGNHVAVPEIADYELRRELLRASKAEGIRRLDALEEAVLYLPITTDAMRIAARFWAQMRREGAPTATDQALDGDVILAAQAKTAEARYDEVVLATTNVGHLSRVADARAWEEIA